MRRLKAGVIVVVSVALLAACSGGGTSGGSQAKEADPSATLTFFDSAPNPNLDPTDPINDSSFSQATLFAVYDRLVGFDPDGVPEPQLATEWSYSDDLKTVTLKLREGVTFHDGEPFDAAAVKANLERSKKVGDAAGNTVKAAAAEIDSVETPDDLTAVIHLNTPDGGFVYSLGTQIGMMLSPAVLDGSTGLDLQPIGAGPYKVDEFKPSDTTTFSRYDDYWDGKEDRPAKLVVKYVVDANTRLNAARSGEATVSLVTPAQVSGAEAGGLETIVNPTASQWTYYLNTSRALKDVRVRQALMYAIDRDTIAEALSFNTGQPTVQLIPEGAPGHVDGAEKQYPYDPEKAKALLEEAGHADGLTLNYILLNSPEYSQITDVIQQQLGEVGIDLKITQVDIAQASMFMQGTGDIMLARWGGRADQLATLKTVVGTGGTYAPAGAVSQELDDALAKAESFSFEEPGRADWLTTANQEVIDQAANVPVMTRSNIYAFKDGCIDGLTKYLAAGSNDWRDVTVGSGC